jgi:hypothetical protein
MQKIILILIIAASVSYLIYSFMKSLRAKKKGHCSGCGKD